MTKLLAIGAAAVLTMTSCGGDEPQPTRTTPPAQTGTPTGAPTTAKPAGPATAPGYPNIPIPVVSPDPPGVGESTGIKMKIEGSGADPLSDNSRAQRPAVHLSRSPEEAEVVARVLPPRVADFVRSWNAYGKRALVVVTGGGQPDASYGIKLDSLSVSQGGKVLSAFGEITTQGGASAQVITVPWVVASVRYAPVVLTERCVLAMTGTTARQSRCHGA